MKPGDKVVVVDPWEESGEMYVRDKNLVGWEGEIVGISTPASMGDDPETDPLYIVDLKELGDGYVFWTEELQFLGH